MPGAELGTSVLRTEPVYMTQTTGYRCELPVRAEWLPKVSLHPGIPGYPSFW